MLTFHIIFYKMFRRKLLSLIKRVITVSALEKFNPKNVLRKIMFKISTDSKTNWLVNECWRFSVWKRLISLLPFIYFSLVPYTYLRIIYLIYFSCHEHVFDNFSKRVVLEIQMRTLSPWKHLFVLAPLVISCVRSEIVVILLYLFSCSSTPRK